MNGAIGLGLDENLSSLKRQGIMTYEKWFEEGLTRIDPAQANSSTFQFEKAFTDAANKTPRIVFDLSDMEIAKALQDGPKGFVSKNYTNAELYRILNKPKWLQKTTFFMDGQLVRPVIENGDVIGFVP